MRPFSVTSLLNQTATVSAVDRPSLLSSSRPAALDISNLLCSTAVISNQVRVPPTVPLISSLTSSSNYNTTPMPLSITSASRFLLPPISNTWPVAAATTPPAHHLSSPPTSKSLLPIESNSIWMHDSMASSASSVASNATLSSCGSIEPVTASIPSTPTTTFPVRALSLKKQPHCQLQLYRTSPTNNIGTKRAFYDDDFESPCDFASGLVSSDEELASPSSSLPAIKAKRRKANAKQLEVLNRVFDRTAFPSTQLRAEIGRQLGMTPRTVQIWFQNRRQAIRTRDRQRSLQIVRDKNQPEDTPSS